MAVHSQGSGLCLTDASTFEELSVSADEQLFDAFLVNLNHGRSLYSVRDCGTLTRLLRDTSHNTTSFGHSLKTFFLSVY